jgi:hypothetical protein
MQVMQSTRLGQGAKFFRAEECRDNHGRLQPAPPIVLGPMAAGSELSSGGAAPAPKFKPGQVGWDTLQQDCQCYVVKLHSLWYCTARAPSSAGPTFAAAV